jgi:hypothetical protein
MDFFAVDDREGDAGSTVQLILSAQGAGVFFDVVFGKRDVIGFQEIDRFFAIAAPVSNMQGRCLSNMQGRCLFVD